MTEILKQHFEAKTFLETALFLLENRMRLRPAEIAVLETILEKRNVQ